MGDFLVNDFPRYVVLLIWIKLNVFMFVYFCYIFETEEKWFYLRTILGRGLCLARGSAACLNLNCMLILIPVCRNVISFIRGSGRSVRRTVRRLLDKNITFHKIIAWSIVFHSAIHTGSHFWNFERICYIWDDIPGMRCIPPAAQPVESPGPVPINIMWTTWAGFTGHIILIALFLMVTSSIEIIRRSYFEVFWYTHHLFVVFYACLIIHGFQGLLKGQTNTNVHNPKHCYSTYLQKNGTTCVLATKDDINCQLQTAEFAAGGAQTWKWVVGPLALYLLERLLRFYRAQQRVVITKVVQHPSKTIELQMQKRGFFAEAGQYIFVQVPEVAALEWHPFTLTSSPEEKYFSIHIRVVGDWTEALAKRLGVGNEEFQQSYDLPKINVDGPFGTASEDIFRFRIGVCIGAGIGVTPFASILKSIWYQMFGANRDADVELKLKKVYVYWICPDTQAFEWFADLLKTLEDQLIENGMADFLDYNIYLTRGWDQNLAKNIMLHEDDSHDVITGLQQKTHFGRPQWGTIFENMAAAHTGEDIGVFFCGPKVLSGALHQECNRCTDIQRGTRFYYNKENF